jgi:hypothetical protein
MKTPATKFVITLMIGFLISPLVHSSEAEHYKSLLSQAQVEGTINVIVRSKIDTPLNKDGLPLPRV